MKTFRRMATLALVAATLVLAGCTPEEKTQIIQNILDDTPSSLEGTLWICDNANETFDGVQSKVYSTIRFDNETEGYYYQMSITNGDTVEDSFKIHYSYSKPEGDLTLIIDGEPSLNMDFKVAGKLLNLKIRNGAATRTYRLVENTFDSQLNLICSEWENVERDENFTQTTVLSFVKEGEMCLIHTEINSEDPSENEYEYQGVTYTIKGNSGTFYEEEYAYDFTIEGNTMTIVDDYGYVLTLTRRDATAPRLMANTSWEMRVYDEYYYEDRGTYWPDQLVLTYNFTSGGKGYGHSEYTVPDLPGIADESVTEEFTYNYDRPKGSIYFKEGSKVTVKYIALSDMLVVLGPDGDHGILYKITNK